MSNRKIVTKVFLNYLGHYKITKDDVASCSTMSIGDLSISTKKDLRKLIFALIKLLFTGKGTVIKKCINNG